MKKLIQHIAVLTLIILSNVAISQEYKMIAFVPEDDEIIYVNPTFKMFHVILPTEEKIDSTVYQVVTMNRWRQKNIQEFAESTNPYTLQLPMNIGEYSSIKIVTYHKGKVVKEKSFQIVFRENQNPTKEYVCD